MKSFSVIFLVAAVVVGILQASPVPNDEENRWILAGQFEKEDCSKDVKIGRTGCAALYWRYTWSVDENKCIKTTYGGCHPSKNNFSDEEECMRVAAPVCRA